MGAASLPGIVLAACARAAAPAGAPSASDTPATISLYSRTSEQEAFTKRVAQFQDQFPKIKVDYSPLPGDYPSVIRTQAAAGTLADVLYLQNLVFEGLASTGGVQPIDALVKRDKVNLAQWFESGIKGFTMDGKLYGLPARGQIQHCYLYFNRDAFQRAGIADPNEKWALDDLAAAADRLTNRGEERFGYVLQWGAFGHLVATTRLFGGDALTPDAKKSLVDSPQALQAMQWHWDLWHRKQSALPVGADAKDFGSGKVAMMGMMLAGQRSDVKNAVKGAFAWDMVPMPKGPTGKLGADTSIAPVTLNSKIKGMDQGWELLKWLTDKETGIALALQKTGSNTPGMRKDVYCDERVVSDPDYPRAMLDRVCKLMDLAPTAPYVVPWNYRQPEVEAAVKKHLDGFINNTTAPTAAAMKAFHTDLQAALDLPRATGS
jgi:multiple sugar transport system substrate-binding protein